MNTLSDFHALTLEKQDTVERPRKQFYKTKEQQSPQRRLKQYKKLRRQLEEEYETDY